MSHAAELLVDAHAVLGEGPVWDDLSQCLLWVDVEKHRIHLFEPSSGRQRVAEVGQRIGSFALRPSGPLLIATEGGLANFDLESEASSPIVDPESHLPGNRFNDGKCDPRGRFWVGSMAFDFERGVGALYRYEGGEEITRVHEGVTISNGLAWTADHATMYYIDSIPGTVTAFDFDVDTGTVTDPRVVIAVAPEMGAPDGMAIDRDDKLWVAHWGGGCVRQWDPRTGRVLDEIAVPASQVTSCAFGGAGLDQLFITTARGGLSDEQRSEEPHAGGLFVSRPGARGLPTDRFVGL